MIDKTQPRYEFTEGDAMDGRPGILVVPDEYGYRLAFSGEDAAHEESDVLAMRQEYATAIADWMTKTAVVDFAERVATWLKQGAPSECFGRSKDPPLHFAAEQIIAAARGERSLP